MQHNPEDRQPEPGRHSWLWMVLCCVPMIATIILIAFGFWSWR